MNYSTSRGLIKLKFFLDYEAKTLKVYTASNPKGEIYSDLPEMGLYPAAQNMTMRNKNTALKVVFCYDLAPFECDPDTGCIREV